MRCVFSSNYGAARCHKLADKVVRAGGTKFPVCFKHFRKWKYRPTNGYGLGVKTVLTTTEDE